MRHPGVTSATSIPGAALTSTSPALGAVVPENSLRLLGHDAHTHDVPELIYVVAGRARLVIEDRPVHLRAREAVWLAPDVLHSARYASHSMVFGALLSETTLPPGRMQVLAPSPQLTQLMMTILGAAPVGESQIRPFRAALDELLSTLHRDHFGLRMPLHPAARRVAGAAPRSTLTLAELARAERISPRQVQRLFREETGLPFARWRTRARLNLAIRALHGGSSLAAAAHGAGYATRNGLLRALSRETGLAEPVLAADPVTALTAR